MKKKERKKERGIMKFHGGYRVNKPEKSILYVFISFLKILCFIKSFVLRQRDLFFF